MYRNMKIDELKTQVFDYLGNITMWTLPGNVPQWDKGSCEMLEGIVKAAAKDDRRQAENVFTRLQAYSYYNDRAVSLSSEFRKYMSEYEFKHFQQVLTSYFVELFEVGYPPEELKR